MPKPAGRVALITGAAGGQGVAEAELFARGYAKNAKAVFQREAAFTVLSRHRVIAEGFIGAARLV
jgi:NAD(P)-dependent dehydrogenase (short-subunit alcohol dehydrogenase family)